MIVHHPQSRLSRELADELRRSIETFQMRNPKLTSDDVRRAAESITPRSGSTLRAETMKGFAVAAGVAVLIGIGGVMSKIEHGQPIPWIPVTAGLGIVLAVGIGVLLRARDR